MTERMRIARFASPGAALLACAALWLGYENLSLLRGTALWEFRYVVLGCAGFLLLTGAERLASWLGKRGGVSDP